MIVVLAMPWIDRPLSATVPFGETALHGWSGTAAAPRALASLAMALERLRWL
jgi:acyl dehydratase